MDSQHIIDTQVEARLKRDEEFNQAYQEDERFLREAKETAKMMLNFKIRMANLRYETAMREA